MEFQTALMIFIAVFALAIGFFLGLFLIFINMIFLISAQVPARLPFIRPTNPHKQPARIPHLTYPLHRSTNQLPPLS